MFRDLLFVATGTAGDDPALSGAASLASSLDAHLTALETVVFPVPVPSPWGIIPDPLLEGLYGELRAKGEANAVRMRAALERQGVRFEMRVAEARFVEPPRFVAMHARHADLSVITAAKRDDADEAGIVESLFGGLLFESGRPVLVLPRQHPLELPFGHAVVAWRPTREATRALHDALPLLARAATVDVLTVEEETDARQAVLEGSDIAAHLARHGLNANVVVRPHRPGETVATALLRHAADSDARLLVAGGYGHSRLREWVLGGTTRELLQAICLPILFSH